MNESPRQIERRAFLDNFFPKVEPRPAFQPRVLRQSTVFQPVEPKEPARIRMPQTQGGKSKNESVGKEGALIFVDCDGAEVGRITWKRGQIQEDGEQTIEGGCDGGTSSPS